MKWLVFSYSLPAKINTAARVRIWRKLRKMGAVSHKSGTYILPSTEDCLESIRSLSAEVIHEQGEALVMKVDGFDNIPDSSIVELFQKERATDYQEIVTILAQLEMKLHDAQDNGKQSPAAFQRDFNKLKKNIENVAKLDFFQSGDQRWLLDRLHNVRKNLAIGNLVLLLFIAVGTLQPAALSRIREECLDTPHPKPVSVIKSNANTPYFLLKN